MHKKGAPAYRFWKAEKHSSVRRLPEGLSNGGVKGKERYATRTSPIVVLASTRIFGCGLNADAVAPGGHIVEGLGDGGEHPGVLRAGLGGAGRAAEAAGPLAQEGAGGEMIAGAEIRRSKLRIRVRIFSHRYLPSITGSCRFSRSSTVSTKS